MNDHRTRYLLAAKDQERYDEFGKVDTPERLEAELSLARTLCESAATAGNHSLAANILQTIAKLSLATTAQKVRCAELLEKQACLRLGGQLVALVTDAIRDRFPGWEIVLENLANQVVATVEQTENEPEPKRLLEGPK